MRLLFAWLCALQYTLCLNILVYNPGHAHSHMRSTGLLVDILVEAGHNITEIRATFDPSLSWHGISKAQQTLTYGPSAELSEVVAATKGSDGFFARVWDTERTPAKFEKLIAHLQQSFLASCENLVFATDLIQRLRGGVFDLAMSESFDSCGFGIFEMLSLKKFVATSASVLMDHQAEIFGLPRVLSYVPGCVAPLQPNMAMTQRMSNVISYYYTSKIFLGICDETTALFRRKLGTDFRSLREVTANSAFLFTNSHPYIDFPRPTVTKIVDIGGIQLSNQTSTKFGQEWEDILRNKSSTVLISFGSIAKSSDMPVAYKNGIIEAIKNLPDIQFIWKYEADDLQDVPANLHIARWTPQAALLKDDRVKLFITHGGLLSAIDIAYIGIPAITIPLFGDQPRNSQVLKYRGVAVVFDKFDLAKPEVLTRVITGVLNDASYRQRALELRDVLQNLPFNPKELFVRNVEFAGKFGNLPKQDNYSRHLSLAEFYFLDVLGLLLLSCIAALAVLSVALKCVYRCCLGAKVKTE